MYLFQYSDAKVNEEPRNDFAARLKLFCYEVHFEIYSGHIRFKSHWGHNRMFLYRLSKNAKGF